MSEIDFEGSLILEKLAEIEKVNDFLDAIDSDNFSKAQKLLRLAGIDKETIASVMKVITEDEDINGI